MSIYDQIIYKDGDAESLLRVVERDEHLAGFDRLISRGRELIELLNEVLEAIKSLRMRVQAEIRGLHAEIQNLEISIREEERCIRDLKNVEEGESVDESSIAEHEENIAQYRVQQESDREKIQVLEADIEVLNRCEQKTYDYLRDVGAWGGLNSDLPSVAGYARDKAKEECQYAKKKIQRAIICMNNYCAVTIIDGASDSYVAQID